MKKVVLDTNIYISGFAFLESIPRTILELEQISSFHLYISKQIISEIRGVLAVKFAYSLEMLDLLENLLLNICTLVEPSERINLIIDDPEDNKILECAQEEKADIIVSGDKHLLKVKNYKGTKIIKAREFLEEIKQ